MSVEPNMQKFLDALAAAGGPPILHADARRGAKGPESNQAGGSVKAPAADIEDRTIPVGPQGSTRIRIVRPHGVTERLPVVLYLHVGGMRHV